MSSDHQPIKVEDIRSAHRARRKEIKGRLAEFHNLWLCGTDDQLWEELVYCIFTAGASARMGFRSIEAIRPLLKKGRKEQMTRALKKAGAHRFPIARPEYVVTTRNFLQAHCGMRLRETLQSFSNPLAVRDWLAQETRIKGIGFKESSHFLRNVGFRGYAILDKHVIRCLADVGLIASGKPPSTRTRYLEIEEKLREFANEIKIDFDELDLVLWSMKTGEVLK